MAQGHQLIGYYESDPDEFGEFGEEKFAIIDSSGRLVRTLNSNEVALGSGYGSTAQLTLPGFEPGSPEDNPFNQKLRFNYSGGANNGGITIYTDPRDLEGDILIDFGENSGMSGEISDKVIRLPKGAAQIIKNMTPAQQDHF